MCMEKRDNTLEGKQPVMYYIGMDSLGPPHKIKQYVLDWFGSLISEQEEKLKDVKSTVFLLVLRQNEDNDLYDYGSLYVEIISWVKREFDVDLLFKVKHNLHATTNGFYFFAGTLDDAESYEKAIEKKLWYHE